MKGKLSFFSYHLRDYDNRWIINVDFGRDAIHLGASGVILGYMGYFMMYWYLDQSILNTITLIVLLYYIGGILMGLMPDDDSVSWEGHVFGFIAGIMSALLGLSYLHLSAVAKRDITIPRIYDLQSCFSLVFHFVNLLRIDTLSERQIQLGLLVSTGGLNGPKQFLLYQCGTKACHLQSTLKIVLL